MCVIVLLCVVSFCLSDVPIPATVLCRRPIRASKVSARIFASKALLEPPFANVLTTLPVDNLAPLSSVDGSRSSGKSSKTYSSLTSSRPICGFSCRQYVMSSLTSFYQSHRSSTVSFFDIGLYPCPGSEPCAVSPHLQFPFSVLSDVLFTVRCLLTSVS